MAKKGGGGAPMWMATFADLMSLLLTLFVLLLTFAEMDIIKYRQIAGVMREAFGVTKKTKLAGVIELDGTLRRSSPKNVDPSKRVDTLDANVGEEEIEQPPPSTPQEPTTEPTTEQAQQQAFNILVDSLHEREFLARKIAEDLQIALQEEILNDGVSVDYKGDKIITRFPNDTFFQKDSIRITDKMKLAIAKMTPVIREIKGTIKIGGHTDDVPVTIGGFRSNWEFSIIRAVTIVHEFLYEHLLEPARLSVEGYGDSVPLGDNTTPQGRAENRRLEITLTPPVPDAVHELAQSIDFYSR